MARVHDLALAALARGQGGVLTADDLTRDTGRNDELARRVRSGVWQEILPGTVVPAAMPRDPKLLAAALCIGLPRSLLSHYDAAALSGIWVPETDKIWATVPFACPLRVVPEVRLVRSRAFPEEFLRRGFLRWTTPARTVVDLGMQLSRKQLESVLLSGVRRGVVTADEVMAQAGRLRGRKGVAKARAVAGLWSPERESLLEDRLFEDVTSVVGAGAVRQLQVRGRDGNVTARLDIAVPELRLAFEADGLHFHSTDAQIAADQKRDRMLLAIGWLVVRFREGALDNTPSVRREITALVDRRRRDLRAD